VSTATRKIAKAMIAATSTAALSFVPLIFIGGILGKFIRAIPVTIIIALIVSLFTALIFIPLFSRYLLLGKKQLGAKSEKEIAAKFESKAANLLSAPMLWARHSRKKLVSLGIIALIVGFGFIGTAGYLFQKVTFNIFPPSKDSDVLAVTLTFPPHTDIQHAEAITDQADKLIGDTLGQNFVKASYYGQADVRQAALQTQLIGYKDRKITSPELADKLKGAFDKNFHKADVEVSSNDVGPPPAAFTAQVNSNTNRNGAIRLADDVVAYLKKADIKRADGSKIVINSTSVTNTSIYNRKDSEQFVEISAKYKDTDTTTLFDQTKKAIQKEFPPSRVASYGLPKDSLKYDFGQETENQDSFKTLAIAFPVLLLAIFILLAFQFRSLLQPLLIFMAIPFSLFGITLGLFLTNNAFSFFSALGFFAMVGLSIKNTILLTDYANQARREGMNPVDAAHEALKERFRPLVATSLTAVASLTPLGLSSPFWQGLTVVLIGGLLSSTFLVLTVFPYYYLGAEFLRGRISRRKGILWLILTVALSVLLAKASTAATLLAPVIAALLVKYVPRLKRS
jgi:multidrug efflux pump subunit AcrB